MSPSAVLMSEAKTAYSPVLTARASASIAVELQVGQKSVLLGVVFRIEIVRVDRLLANDRIEEVAVLRHMPARTRAPVSLGIDQDPALLGLDRHPEILRHEHFEAVEGPWLPVAVLEAEHVGAAHERRHVDADRLLEVVLDQPQHLVGLAHLHQPLLEAVMVSQCGDAAHMHAGDGGAAEIDRQAIRLAMIDRVENALALRSDFFSSRSSPRVHRERASASRQPHRAWRIRPTARHPLGVVSQFASPTCPASATASVAVAP